MAGGLAARKPDARPIGRDRWVVPALLALSVAQSVAVLVPAWAVKRLFDQALHPAPASPSMAGTLIAFIGATLVVIAIEVLKRRVAAERAILHAAKLRSALFRKRLEGVGPAPSKGSLLLPFVGDLTAARRWQAEGLPRAVSAAVLLPVVIAMIAWQSAAMAIAMTVALGVSLAASTLLLGPMERAVRDVRSVRGSLTSYLTGRLLAADVVRTSGRVGQELGKVARRTQRLAVAERRRAWTIGASRGAARLTSGLLLLAALYSGIGEVGRGHLSGGAVAGALTLVGLLGQGVTDIGRAIELWKPAKVSYERVAAILDRPSPRRRRSKAALPDSGLWIGSLKIGSGMQLADVSAERGSIVLIDGQNRAGKSALLAAIAMPPHRASTLSIDGVDLAAASERKRAKLVGYARSGMPVIGASLGHNLDYRSSGASLDELRDTARLCGLQPLIDRLPGGLSGRIREEDELSASERAGIALARAMVGDPALLLIDSIDAELDMALVDRIGRRLGERGGVTLLVARKAAWRGLASHHWVLADGHLRVAATAPHDNVVPIDQEPR